MQSFEPLSFALFSAGTILWRCRSRPMSGTR